MPPSIGTRSQGSRARLLSGLSALGLGAWLAGCTVGPDYHMPDLPLPESFLPPVVEAEQKESRAPPSRRTDFLDWWQSLHDPELDSLIARALESNLDLEIALTRIEEAETQELVVIGQSLPAGELDAGGAAGTGSNMTLGRASPVLRSAENSDNLSKRTVVGGFDASWELDIFGKFRRMLEAATDDAEALASARDWVLVTVAADVARAYLDMRAFQKELAILRQNIGVAKGSYDFQKSRFAQGITNELDVALAQRHLETLRSEAAPLEAQIAASQHVIAVLLGEFPEELAKELARPGKLPALPARVQPGLPPDLLRRRPDIHAAERQLAAATARIGVATADLFPRLIVSGALGGQGGTRSSSAVPLTFIGAAGPSLYWPVLDFGTLDATADIAELQAHEFFVHYKQTVLTAVRQVDDAVAAYAAAQQRLRDLGRARNAARQATKLATDRYDRGLTDYLNVLDAERQEFELEEQYASTEQTAAEQLTHLYKALGGGWQRHEVMPPIKEPQPPIIAAVRRVLEGGQVHQPGVQ